MGDLTESDIRSDAIVQSLLNNRIEELEKERLLILEFVELHKKHEFLKLDLVRLQQESRADILDRDHALKLLKDSCELYRQQLAERAANFNELQHRCDDLIETIRLINAQMGDALKHIERLKSNRMPPVEAPAFLRKIID